MDAESLRLAEDATREKNWTRWGPYLAERQWGTVREDYSASGNCWDYLPHDHARSRAYRWGEDGLMGITDRECRLCFALALWNGRDPILKDRLFGLNNGEGNHGEDVKECYYYLDATPTSSYLRGLYKYPQAAYPYAKLVEENRRRGTHDPEFELTDTGLFDDNRYFDIAIEYAKQSPNYLCIRITATNCGPEAAALHLLPTLWFRNTWSWGCKHEGCWPKPRLAQADEHSIVADHVTLGRYFFVVGDGPDGRPPEWIYTDNETNHARLFGYENATPYVKDSFHDYLIHGVHSAVNPKYRGTKAAAVYKCEIAPRQSAVLRFQLFAADEAMIASSAAGNGESDGHVSSAKITSGPAIGVPSALNQNEFDNCFANRRAEADEFYADRIPADLEPAQHDVSRQAYAGLLWSKQFYEYIVKDWLEGDPEQPTPPEGRSNGRNSDWPQLHNRDVISMPDKWEYPWYAAWDLAFHLVALGRVDLKFAKDQAVLFLREWYMHPNGQLPAYEFAFSDVNPPVHAWAVWRLYKMSGKGHSRDRVFLARCFQKLLINFTWWVNRKDHTGRNLFSGGFLGMDNIGPWDRSQPLPPGVVLLQADGTAWMASYCLLMLSMAMELAKGDPSYEDVASKFFEHFVSIVDAMNTFGGTGLWDDEDGFYYDAVQTGGRHRHLRARSMVG
ncbi:MAG TPA: glucosidase, partial [Pirellulales bacterium]